MIEYVWGGGNNPEAHDAVSQWVSRHSFGHNDNSWPGSTSLGVMRDGLPIAGVIFHDYKPAPQTVQFSAASTDSRWLLGATLHVIFGYIFDDLGCQMALSGNSAANESAHHLLHGLGFKNNVIERGWGRDTALHLWTLTQEQWLENKLMKRSRKSAEENQHV